MSHEVWTPRRNDEWFHDQIYGTIMDDDEEMMWRLLQSSDSSGRSPHPTQKPQMRPVGPGIIVIGLAAVVISAALFAWYGRALWTSSSNRRVIEMEKIIVVTLFLSLLSDITGLAYNGFINYYLRINYMLFVCFSATKALMQTGVLVLIAMISMGRGRTLVVLFLGAIYVALSLASTVVALKYVQAIFEDEDGKSFKSTDQLLWIGNLLRMLVLLFNVVCLVWLLYALRKTVEYLQDNRHWEKVERYRRFFRLLIACLVVATVLALNYIRIVVFHVFPKSLFIRIVTVAVSRANQLVILGGIAYLWYPSPANLDYECVMELPPLPDDDDRDHGDDNIDTVTSSVAPDLGDETTEKADNESDHRESHTIAGTVNEVV